MYPSYGIYRDLYCFTDILQEFQSSGRKSFLTISCINMSCCKIISPRLSAFNASSTEWTELPICRKPPSFPSYFPTEILADECMDGAVFLLRLHRYVICRNLISLTDFQYLLCQTRIFFLRQILFPQNNRLRMKAAYTLDLFCKGTLTQERLVTAITFSYGFFCILEVHIIIHNRLKIMIQKCLIDFIYRPSV